MRLVKVAAAILNQTPLDWSGNAARIRSAIQTARSHRVSVLCLPELCISGYGCEDMFLSPGVWQTSLDRLRELLPETAGMVVSFGLPLFIGNGVYNCVGLAVDGHLAGFVAKQHLAGDGLHYEPRWFRAWPEDTVAALDLEGMSYPVGDLVFDVGGVRMGFEICEDAWVASRPGSGLAARGVDIILNPSASHFAFGKHEIRKRFVLEGSRAFGVSYVYSNLVGNESGRAIYDGGALVASGAQLLAVGPRFVYSDCEITSAVVDVDLNRATQARTVAMRSDIGSRASAGVTAVSFEFPACEELPEPEAAADVQSREDEFTRAIGLGLFDYLRKSRSHGFVISMSGGADSSAVACLVRAMAELSVADIGASGVRQRLSHIPGIEDQESVDGLVGRLLTGIYQATRNSSDTTRDAARAVTEAVGGRFLEINVDAIVQQYCRAVEEAIGRELSWQADDIALQNIQARTRGPAAWMLANLGNSLLLATSNRSEAAVGYATMDGDTCGGLSPIAGIDKAFLRKWLVRMETDGACDVAPVPALQLVNRQQPTAELRPPDQAQTDEDDLMPFPLLDAIERAAIRDKAMPDEILTLMQGRFPQYSTDQLRDWIRRFFQLWSRNQWKRERYAPSFHVDDESLDPKTWCRFPILSGGYETELREL